ncbi:hypothetical protein DL767_008289 [Monosporascus sp. MG133]|nr:hypothetical protein DL767_008289 [Monosporascus sp. MG133]
MGRIGNAIQLALDYIAKFDDYINESTFGRVFRLDGSGHPKSIRGATFLREVRAGLTTFATMAYIIAVNSAVLSESGGTCVCPDPKNDQGCIGDGEYALCLVQLKRDLITSTAALAGFSSIVFGFLTNLPVALGPGMGLNAYFTYQVVGWHGTGHIPYRVALTAVFVEGFIFMFLALTGMRQWMINMIPATIKTACGVGIGLFLTEIGLSYSAGVGAITGGYATPLTIGGCPAEFLNEKGECQSNIMANPAMWIGITLGGILIAFLMAFKVKSAIMIGIGIVSVLSWPRNTSFTYFPHTPDGESRYQFFSQVIAFHPIEKVLAVQDWDLQGLTAAKFVLALMTFLYVDIIDCTATLYSMAKFCGVVEEDGDFPRSTIAYCTDAACISIGSLFGCSPVTAFIESGAGIAEGGRTGLTAIATGVCFLLSLFFAPILASVPPWATGGTLVLVGCLMIRQVCNINWQYIGDAVPSFVTLAFMPFSYSVAYGLIACMDGPSASGQLLSPYPKAQTVKNDHLSGTGKLLTWVRVMVAANELVESDAGVFTYLLDNLGVKDVQFEELLTLEPESLASLYPVYGVIFLFKYPTDTPYTSTDKPLDGDFDRDAAERLFFAAQTIQNACGTQALLSVLMNKEGEIDIGEKLREFKEFTMVLPPEFRGEALSNSELIRDVHNSFAKSSPFVDETQRSGGEPEDAFHFVAYAPIDGKLYELDGLQPAPISHGACTSEDFPARVMEGLQRRIARYDLSEIRFNLMAMVRDLRIRAREIGDAEMLAREERKRRDWQFENALRRHNFVGFAGAVLKAVTESKLREGDGAYAKWIEEATARTRHRIDTKKKGGGGDDVEMEG